MKKDPRVYLAHILECAEKIERYTKGGERKFLKDTMTQDAVIRNFEIIDSLAAPPPSSTRRDVRLPGISGKAVAVIGPRRAGRAGGQRHATCLPGSS